MKPLREFVPLLERINAVDTTAPPNVADLRRSLGGALQKWGGVGPKVAAVTNMVVHTRHRPIPVRIYVPRLGRRPLPVIVFCHGSGFVAGGLDTHDSLARHLALAVNAVVVGVDYLLAPEHRFPVAIEECLEVADWIAAGGIGPAADSKLIVLAGDSAGGAIASGASLMARDRGGPSLRAQILLYPACDVVLETESWHRYGSGHFLDAPTMSWFWSQYIRNPTDCSNAYAVPLAANDLRGMPPTVLITAGCDPLKDEAQIYAERLADFGVEVRAFSYDRAIHGFMSMFAISPSAAVAVRMVATALSDLAQFERR